MIGIIFIVLMLASCGTAAVLGGRDGRWFAGLYIAAIIATHYARKAESSWASPHLPVFMVDLGLLVGLVALALTSRRYWTIWVAGLHVLTVMSHASVWFVGDFDPRVYFVLESVWSPIKLVVVVLGVLLDWSQVDDTTGGGAA